VLPQYQRQGIGKALVQEGLSLLKAQGGQGCVLVGDPNYYKRFGFRNIAGLVYEGIPQEVFLALPFNSEEPPCGVVLFHKGFFANCFFDLRAQRSESIRNLVDMAFNLLAICSPPRCRKRRMRYGRIMPNI
jgi:hypothetical protein